MGDLSWNPSTWTPSNLAEELVEGLTGSEGLGDVAGLWAAGATGDVKGMADQSFDLGDNVGKGIGKFVEGVWNAAKDAIEVFSNPGQVKPPQTPATPPPGYADQADQADQAGQAGQAGQDGTDVGGFDGGLPKDWDSMSLEAKVFSLLMKLHKEKEGKLNEKVNELGGKEKPTQAEMFELQQAQSELGQMTQLTTNIMQSFKQAKDSVIQNIGR